MDFKEDFIYRILAGEVSEEEELAFRKRLAKMSAKEKNSNGSDGSGIGGNMQ